MYRDFVGLESMGGGSAVREELSARVAWSVIIPFYNEQAFLADTIASLAAQHVPFELILVDNGSSDGSADVACSAAETHGLHYQLVTESRPGKVHALAAGMARVATRFVATCDADTWYPPHYLETAGALLAQPGCVAAGAYFVDPDWDEARAHRAARRVQRSARLLAGQCHTGGAGQVFDTIALHRAGGFDPRRWNYVLEDHEIIHQILKHGRMAYTDSLWCMPSPRERKRGSTKWTRLEQLVYHLTASHKGDWFFSRFFGPRLEQRRLTSDRLREAPQTARFGDAPAYSVCG